LEISLLTIITQQQTSIKTIKTGITEISSNNSGFKVRIENSEDENISLPAGSPFTDWKEARRFAGPLPFTFTYNPSNKEVLIIEGVRENWKPMPVKVIDHNFSFIDNLKLNGLSLQMLLSSATFPTIGKKVKSSNGNKKKKAPGRFKYFKL
jgi:hypothetical protein